MKYAATWTVLILSLMIMGAMIYHALDKLDREYRYQLVDKSEQKDHIA